MEAPIFIIVIAALFCGTMMMITLFKSIFKYASAKSRPQQADASLTTSELHGLIRDAVAEATEPLDERVAALEQHLGAHNLLAGTDGYLAEVPNAPQRQPVR